jgi:hypothetical protein
MLLRQPASWVYLMTEQSPKPRQRNTIPRKSIPYVILGLGLLLVADLIVVKLIFNQGLIPTTLLSATPTETGALPTETMVTSRVFNGAHLVATTSTPTLSADTPSTELPTTETPVLEETPIFTGTPASTTSFTPSLTPVYESCQYTLKPGKNDFLYSIYWNWHINQNIPVLNNFYAKITCAVLLSNLKCSYHADSPGITQPGWILILPGVSANICLYHGGTPVP